MAEYTIGACEIYDNVPTGTAFNLTNLDFPTNAEVTDDGAGEIYATQQSLVGFAPVATFSTKNLATVLNFIGLNGQCVGATQDVTQVDLFSRKLETCQSSLGATPHLRDRVSTGLLRLGSLSAARGEDATLSVILDALTDAGGSAPVARTDGVALPTTIVSTRYTLGECSIAGFTFTEIDSVTIDFGVSITDKSPALGAIWPDAVGVLTVRPTLTLTGRDLSRVKTAVIGLGATAATHANTSIQLIKRKHADSFESFGSTVHTTLTLAGLVTPEMLVSSSPGSRATNAIRLPAYYDGTNAPVLIDTTTTYTAS